ncbi:DUF4124 domain-containing protein [Lysobacter cavernae]|uniref:DUF4124 domain-containing protein n=1 Tax=Lysobacter cavernae TaxID=1685901 RepID=A0ABV7RRX7_9GAMM
MRSRLPRWLPLALLFAATITCAAEITIYRCTDQHGRLTLRDTPCAKGETQQAREMQRPKDPPPRPAAVVKPAAPAVTAAPPAPRYVVVTPPRPMYDCVTPDGEHYLSDTDAGNPRWVPLWTLGYPAYPMAPYPHGGVSGRLDFGGGDVRGSVRLGEPGYARPPRPGPPVAALPAGTWVRDACYPLPQQDVCERLRDRRYELGRRYNSALQSERHRIDDEQRILDARLANDCAGY